MNLSKGLWTLGTAVEVFDRITLPEVSRVGFSITAACNQRCKTCDIWKKPSSELSLGDLEKFCKKNPSLLWASVTGGEPTLRKDLGSVLETVIGIRSMRLVNTTTNGQKPGFLEQEIGSLLKKTKKAVKLTVSVSIEGLEETHDEITGKAGSYALALESFRLLKSLSKHDWRLETRFLYTISKYNQGQLRSTIDTLSKKFSLSMSDFVVGIAMEAPYFGRDGNTFQIGPTELESELRDFLGMYGLKDRVNITGLTNYSCLNKVLQGKKPRLVGLQYNVMVDSNWYLYPSSFQYPDYPVGNLKDYNFSIKSLLYAKQDSYVDYSKYLWTQCESYPTLIFRPWRLL